LLAVEVLAAGQEGAKRHDAAVAAFARRLGLGSPGEDEPLPEAEWARVAGVLALVGRLAMAGEADRLPALEDELAAALSAQS
jgi:hypothetical protein